MVFFSLEELFHGGGVVLRDVDLDDPPAAIPVGVLRQTPQLPLGLQSPRRGGQPPHGRDGDVKKKKNKHKCLSQSASLVI